MADSAVDVWLHQHGLAAAAPALAAAGYDDLHDLRALVLSREAGEFASLVPAPGHRAKMVRLLGGEGGVGGYSYPSWVRGAPAPSPATGLRKTFDDNGAAGSRGAGHAEARNVSPRRRGAATNGHDIPSSDLPPWRNSANGGWRRGKGPGPAGTRGMHDGAAGDDLPPWKRARGEPHATAEAGFKSAPPPQSLASVPRALARPASAAGPATAMHEDHAGRPAYTAATASPARSRPAAHLAGGDGTACPSRGPNVGADALHQNMRGPDVYPLSTAVGAPRGPGYVHGVPQQQDHHEHHRRANGGAGDVGSCGRGAKPHGAPLVPSWAAVGSRERGSVTRGPAASTGGPPPPGHQHAEPIALSHAPPSRSVHQASNPHTPAHAARGAYVHRAPPPPQHSTAPRAPPSPTAQQRAPPTPVRPQHPGGGRAYHASADPPAPLPFPAAGGPYTSTHGPEGCVGSSEPRVVYEYHERHARPSSASPSRAASAAGWARARQRRAPPPPQQQQQQQQSPPFVSTPTSRIPQAAGTASAPPPAHPQPGRQAFHQMSSSPPHAHAPGATGVRSPRAAAATRARLRGPSPDSGEQRQSPQRPPHAHASSASGRGYARAGGGDAEADRVFRSVTTDAGDDAAVPPVTAQRWSDTTPKPTLHAQATMLVNPLAIPPRGGSPGSDRGVRAEAQRAAAPPPPKEELFTQTTTLVQPAAVAAEGGTMPRGGRRPSRGARAGAQEARDSAGHPSAPNGTGKLSASPPTSAATSAMGSGGKHPHPHRRDSRGTGSGSGFTRPMQHEHPAFDDEVVAVSGPSIDGDGGYRYTSIGRNASPRSVRSDADSRGRGRRTDTRLTKPLQDRLQGDIPEMWEEESVTRPYASVRRGRLGDGSVSTGSPRALPRRERADDARALPDALQSASAARHTLGAQRLATSFSPQDRHRISTAGIPVTFVGNTTTALTASVEKGVAIAGVGKFPTSGIHRLVVIEATRGCTLVSTDASAPVAFTVHEEQDLALLCMMFSLMTNVRAELV